MTSNTCDKWIFKIQSLTGVIDFKGKNPIIYWSMMESLTVVVDFKGKKAKF